MATIDDVKASYLAINRVALNDATATAVAAQIDQGTLTLATYQTNLINASETTTQAAFALSTFIQGVVPSSAQVDALTAFAVTQNAYYTNVLQSPNADLGAYEALGKAFAADATTSAAFAAKYGAFSAADFVNSAYAEVFNGAVPSAAAAANLIAQVNYFTTIYTAAGIPAADAALQAKGAVLGQIIGYGFTADAADLPAGGSPLVAAVEATIQTAANEAVAGTAEADSDVYGQPLSGAGAAIAIAVNESVSLDIATVIGGDKATTFGDTVSGLISNAANDVSVNTAAGNDSIGTSAALVGLTENAAFKIAIDGSGGADVLYANLNSTITEQTSIANVEKLYIQNDGAFTVDTTKFTGVQELWSFKSTADVAFSDVAGTTTIGVEGGTVNHTFTFADDVATANLVLKQTVTNTDVTVAGADIETLNVSLTGNSIAGISTVATAVKVTGANELKLEALSDNVKSFDASGLTASLSLGSATSFASTEDATVVLTGKNDIAALDLSNLKDMVITTGDGADTIEVTAGSMANVTVVSSVVDSLATISDFKAGSDKVDVTAGTYDAFGGSLVGEATLESALGTVATATTLTNYSLFEYGGSTYIFTNNGAQGLDDGDGLIKIAGVTGLTYDAGVIS
jgi:hypothetical protein